MNEKAFDAVTEFRHAGQRAAGSDAGDKNVDLAVGVVPDFRPGGSRSGFSICGLSNCCRM